MDNETILFLGSGFSKLAGLPTMADFGRESDAELSRQKLEKEKQPKKDDIFNFFIQKGLIYNDFRDYCKKINKIVNFDENNMEDVFSIADFFKYFGKHNLTLNNSKISIDEVYKSIQIWLWKIFHQLPVLTKRKNEIGIEEGPYEEFIEILKNQNTQINVITTNYDITFESIAFKKDFKCYYPFAKYNALNETNEKYILKYKKKDKKINPVIFKLNGSINYFYDENKKEELFISDDLLKRESGKIIPKILDLTSSKNILFDKKYIPFIIPPAYSKLDQSIWQKEVWKKALKKMANANEILFIGYSMPTSDGFMKVFIQAAMRERNEKFPLHICIIDPDIKTHEKYKNFFKPIVNSICDSSIIHIVKCFSQNCIPDLKYFFNK